MKIFANFMAVVLLIGLIAIPIYFAQNFAQVAGVKSQSKYLVVSQIEKFPNLSLSQNGDRYKITYTKLGPSHAFLQILIVNNPTSDTQIYRLEKIAGEGAVFFGENLEDQRFQITVPSGISVPISLISEPGGDISSLNSGQTQTAEFSISIARF